RWIRESLSWTKVSQPVRSRLHLLLDRLGKASDVRTAENLPTRSASRQADSADFELRSHVGFGACPRLGYLQFADLVG
ncbi:MAG: hypothetical protein U1A73_00880, partial [Pseudomonas sp.]|nr:hypothetical protein [Pseudomonas sp.]